MELPGNQPRNVVKELNDLFTDEQLIKEITHIITPDDLEAKVDMVFQTVDNLHLACPNHLGDWYFTGNYPTPGGIKVALRSFIYAYEGRTERAY